MRRWLNRLKLWWQVECWRAGYHEHLGCWKGSCWWCQAKKNKVDFMPEAIVVRR